MAKPKQLKLPWQKLSFSFILSPNNPAKTRTKRNCAFNKTGKIDYRRRQEEFFAIAAAKNNSSPRRRMKQTHSSLAYFAAAKTISSPGRSSLKSSEITELPLCLLLRSILGALPWEQASSCFILLRTSPIF